MLRPSSNSRLHRIYRLKPWPIPQLADVLDVVFLGLLGIFLSFFSGCFHRRRVSRLGATGLKTEIARAENEGKRAGQASRSRVEFSLGFIEAG